MSFSWPHSAHFGAFGVEVVYLPAFHTFAPIWAYSHTLPFIRSFNISPGVRVSVALLSWWLPSSCKKNRLCGGVIFHLNKGKKGRESVPLFFLLAP